MLFDKFLSQYIEDLIDCGDKEYDITEADKKEIMNNICDNEHLWETLDHAVYYELSKYEIEEDQ